MNKVAEALIGDIPTATVDPVAASLTSYNPSIRERIGNSVYDAARYLGMESIANRLRNDFESGIDFVPVIGDVVGADDAISDLRSGSYLAGATGLGLAALGTVPIAGDIASGVGKKAGSEVFDLLNSARNRIREREISAKTISEAGRPVRLNSPDGRVAFLSQNTVAGEKPFRVTYFDHKGVPNGHSEVDDLYSAAIKALEDGFIYERP